VGRASARGRVADPPWPIREGAERARRGSAQGLWSPASLRDEPPSATDIQSEAAWGCVLMPEIWVIESSLRAQPGRPSTEALHSVCASDRPGYLAAWMSFDSFMIQTNTTPMTKATAKAKSDGVNEP